MANYSTGLATQEKILSVSKKLFYKNGYRETPFGDICNIAQVNPGTIVYHFKGKANIAQIIYAEMMQKTHNRITELFSKEDDLTIMLLAICTHIHLMFFDTSYRRFTVQITTDCVKEIIEDQYECFSPITFKFLKKYLDPERFNFFLAASAGFDGFINSYISQNINTLNYEQIVNYSCELYLYFLDKPIIDPVIRKCLSIMKNVSISVNEFDIDINYN